MNLGKGWDRPLSADEEVGQTIADPGTGPGSRGIGDNTASSVPVALGQFSSAAEREERGKRSEGGEETGREGGESSRGEIRGKSKEREGERRGKDGWEEKKERKKEDGMRGGKERKRGERMTGKEGKGNRMREKRQ